MNLPSVASETERALISELLRRNSLGDSAEVVYVADLGVQLARLINDHAPMRRSFAFLLIEILSEVTDNYTSCNCSYSADTPPARRCDGTCTHAKAQLALTRLRREVA